MGDGCKIVRQRLSFQKWTNRSIFKKGGKYRSYCGKVQIILSWKKCKCNAPFQLLVIFISCCTFIAYTSSWTEVWGKNQNWIGDIKQTIHKAFSHRNDGSKFVVLGYNSTYFSNKIQKGKTCYSEEQVISMLEFLIDNIFVSFSRSSAYQWVRIVPLF